MPSYSIHVHLEDKPGQFARAARCATEERVNITAFTIERDGARFLTNDPDRAADRFRHEGFRVDVYEVVEILLEDRPGKLASLCQDLAEADINLVAGFGLVHGGVGKVYVAVDDLPRAGPILAKHGDRAVLTHSGLGRL